MGNACAEAALSLAALQATPWSDIILMARICALAPKFVTTSSAQAGWCAGVGCVVEVALDIGQIVAGDKKAPFASWSSNCWQARRTRCSTSPSRLPHPCRAAREHEQGRAWLRPGAGFARYTAAGPAPKLTRELPLSEAARRVLVKCSASSPPI